MFLRARSLAVVAALTAAVFAGAGRGDGGKPVEKRDYTGACADTGFESEVWAKVGARKCLTCHKAGGEAEESKFVLTDPQKVDPVARDEAVRHNRAAFAKMAALKEKDQSRLLLKATGKLDHGGKDVAPANSAEYRVLADFVRRVTAPRAPAELTVDPKAPPLFAGVAMLDD
ncbi:MAG: hypothetical protein ACKODX_20195, partial [Gemmata sp.]